MNESVEVIADDANRCGEGPIWDSARRRLLWTDIPADSVYELLPATGAKRLISRGVNVATIALAKNGGLIFGGSGGLSHWNEGVGCRPVISQHEGEILSINDMIATPAGGIYFGTVYWGTKMERHGKLYLVEPTGNVRVVDEGIELANGLGFSPDGRTLYFADSAPRRIYAYDVDSSGGLSRRRVFAQFSQDDGLPDGLTVDAEGFVWCALWYGGCVVRLDPQGRVERRIVIPAAQTSSLAFGGDAMDELYVTTAGEAWPSDLAPTAWNASSHQGGALYRVRCDIQGKPEFRAAVTA